jgi:dual specificity MAP kinase phosphatase
VGGQGLKKDHQVVQFLAKESKCSSLLVYRDGIDAIQKAYPFLVGQSLNAHRGFVFPTPVESCLYLGNWANASDTAKLDNLKIKRVVTIHNEPRNLKLPSAYHLFHSSGVLTHIPFSVV